MLSSYSQNPSLVVAASRLKLVGDTRVKIALEINSKDLDKDPMLRFRVMS